mgnify:CR=1 FL=1|tara:strand:- start:974 stop:1972 length:999 start_codon:yes stop_codon:yes gene_type:complete
MFAEKSDKWHHTMARYLGLPLNTSFLFGILPGVCREAIGRYDHMYTKRECFNTNLVYAWSKHHAEKINSAKFSNTKAYYGTAPFLWELGKIAYAQENTPEFYTEPSGSLFFLPRDDQVTIREDEYESVQKVIDSAPRPITFLLPWRNCDIWKNWDKLVLNDAKFIQLSNPDNRQAILSSCILNHEHIYIPWPGTDVYYAEFLDKQVHVYDKLEQYRTKTRDEMDREKNHVIHYLKWGYDWLSDNQKIFFEWTRDWNNIDKSVRKNLTIKMLGLDVLKKPEELHDDMKNQGFIHDNQKFTPNLEYDRSYEWLKSNLEKIRGQTLHDHPHMSLL